MNKKINVIKLTDFVYLLFATLADNSKINDKNNKIVCLPVNYKQIIENILCVDNGWKDEFSCLIDVDDYFADHFDWELRLSLAIKNMLFEMNKWVDYNFECDLLLFSFAREEIDKIMNGFENSKLKTIMNHFANLLVDYIYTREYQEKFYDYSAVAVKKMHYINENMILGEGPFQKNKKR